MRYRILEEISIFADGSRRVEFTLQVQCATNPSQWRTLATSATLAEARKALLLHAPERYLGLA